MRAVIAAIAVLAFIPPVFGADAPMFRGNLAHTGIYEGKGTTTLSGIKWKFHTGGMVVSSPAVAGDSVYAGSTDNFLYAIDKASGAQKWKFETKGRVVSSPAVAGGLVYFMSYDGNFYAVDATSGQPKWTFKTEGEHRFTAKHLHGAEPAAEIMPDPWDCYLSSPAVWNGMVFFGSGDGNVYALDAASGAKKWKFKTGDVVHASPAIANGMLYIGSWDANFYALDAATGREKWRFKTGEDPAIHNQQGIQASAAVADGMVFFGARDSHLYALDAASGAKKWDFSTQGSWIITSPAVHKGKVYFATSDSGLIFVFDAKTGRKLTEKSIKGWLNFASPGIAGDMLYTATFGGAVHGLALKNASLVWSFETEAWKKGGAELSKPDGTADFGKSFASNFYDDSVGGYLKLMSLGAFLSSPSVVDGTLYIGNTDGNLYALGLKPEAKAKR